MPSIFYGYYFRSDKPSECKSLKRITSLPNIDFEDILVDINGIKWVLIGVIDDEEGVKGKN